MTVPLRFLFDECVGKPILEQIAKAVRARFIAEGLLMVTDEPIRFYKFARQHGLESRELLEKCHRAGIAIMNQLCTIEPDQRRAIEALIYGEDGGPPLSNDGPAFGPVPAGTGPTPRPLQAAARPKPTSTDDLR